MPPSTNLRDPNYTPPFYQAVPLGIQHVLAMFISNVTPAIIVASAAGFGFGSADTSHLLYLIQMSMLFAGVATLLQTIGVGRIGARLPVMQGTSFAYVPIMVPAMTGVGVAGLGGLMTGIIIGGLFHFVFIGYFIRHIRFALPPLVTGMIIFMIGIALMRIGVEYAAGGVPAKGTAEFGSLTNWLLAGFVILVIFVFKFFFSGFLSVSAILLGILSGYIAAYFFGMVNLSGIDSAVWFAFPVPFRYGISFDWGLILAMCLVSFISAIETVGDTVGITQGGAGRDANDDEIQGATYADGLGTAIAGIFGGLPNTSFSQNVGLVSITGVMSRHVVTIGALFLILCGFVPKIGAVIRTIPIEVLGGGVIVMFGMVAAAGVNMLSTVHWSRRNMTIFAVSLSLGIGVQMTPDALQHLDGTLKLLLTSGLLPSAFCAIILNLLLPEDFNDGLGKYH